MKEEIKEIIGEIIDSYYETQPSTKFYKNISLIEEEIERLCNKVDELMTLYTTERYVKEDYKAIIDKAKEFLDMNKSGYDLSPSEQIDLYYILQGSERDE